MIEILFDTSYWIHSRSDNKDYFVSVVQVFKSSAVLIPCYFNRNRAAALYGTITIPKQGEKATKGSQVQLRGSQDPSGEEEKSVLIP